MHADPFTHVHIHPLALVHVERSQQKLKVGESKQVKGQL
jgi:hypothetical protein